MNAPPATLAPVIEHADALDWLARQEPAKGSMGSSPASYITCAAISGAHLVTCRGDLSVMTVDYITRVRHQCAGVGHECR